MSDKLTTKEIEQMILEALQEQQKLDEVSIKVTNKTKVGDIANKLGISGFKKKEYEDFAKTAKPDNVIDDKDIDKALAYKGTQKKIKKRKEIAQAIRGLDSTDEPEAEEEEKLPALPDATALSYAKDVKALNVLTYYDEDVNKALQDKLATALADLKNYEESDNKTKLKDAIKLSLNNHKKKLEKDDVPYIDEQIEIINKDDHKSRQAKEADYRIKQYLDKNLAGLDDLKKRMEEAVAKFAAFPPTAPPIADLNASEKLGPRIHNEGDILKIFSYDLLADFLKRMEEDNFNVNHILAEILFRTVASNSLKWLESTKGWLKDNTTATSEDVDNAFTNALEGIDVSVTQKRQRRKAAVQLWNAANKGESDINAKLTTSFTTEPKLGKGFMMQDLLDFLNDKSDDLGDALISKLGDNGINVNQLKGMDASLNEAKDVLEPKDIEIWYDKAQDPEDDDLKRDDADALDKALKQFYQEVTSSDMEDVNKGIVRDKISKIIQFEKEASGTTRATQGVTSGYNITSRSATEIGKVDFQMIKAFSAAFPGVTSFNERMNLFGEYVNQVQKNLADPSSAIEGTTSSKFSKFITLDLMQQILYSFEASSAGWVFESFLAFMAFGDAIGASYGAGDFSIPDAGGGKPMEGSAKLLQEGDTSQSTKGWPKFEELRDDEKEKASIRYVIGVKTSKDARGFYKKSTQQDRVGRVALYLIDLKRIGDKVYHGPAGSDIDEDNNKGVFPIDKKDRISITVDGHKPVNIMEFAFLQQAEFEDYSSRIVADISEDLERAMSAMSELKANLDDYVMAESTQVDDKAFASAEALRNYAILGTALGTYEGGKGVFGDSKLKESKLKVIDDLILEAIKNMKKKLI